TAGTHRRKRSRKARGAFRRKGSFPRLREATPDFVEKIHHERYMTTGLSRFGARRRHYHEEALAVGGDIVIPGKPHVRKLLFELHSRFVRYKEISLRCVIRNHDSLVFGPIEQLMSRPRPNRHR